MSGRWDQVRHKLERIELLALDVDGILTDGTLWYMPDGAVMPAGFHVHDGLGIRLAIEAGLKVIFVSGNWTESVRLRAEHLQIDAHWLGTARKPEALKEASAKFNIQLEHMAFMGDDLNDLACFRMVGLPVSVPDAVEELRAAAAVVTSRQGGRGAARETIEAILKAQGKWDASVQSFLTSEYERTLARQ